MTQEEIIYRLAADAVRMMVNDGVSVQTISHHSRLSSSTIRKFMNQSTQYPRFHTVMAVLEYLGIEIYYHDHKERNVP
jgi:DNA-binding phage protein